MMKARSAHCAIQHLKRENQQLPCQQRGIYPHCQQRVDYVIIDEAIKD